MKTQITELFGIEHPIIQGGMHYVGFAELAVPLVGVGKVIIGSVCPHVDVETG